MGANTGARVFSFNIDTGPGLKLTKDEHRR
jgi:hypothetical protein